MREREILHLLIHPTPTKKSSVAGAGLGWTKSHNSIHSPIPGLSGFFHIRAQLLKPPPTAAKRTLCRKLESEGGVRPNPRHSSVASSNSTIALNACPWIILYLLFCFDFTEPNRIKHLDCLIPWKSLKDYHLCQYLLYISYYMLFSLSLNKL